MDIDLTPKPTSKAAAKNPVAVLTGPVRNVNAWAFVRIGKLARPVRRYVAIRSCQLSVFDVEGARTPLVTLVLAGATITYNFSKCEAVVKHDGGRVAVQWNSEVELRACKAAYEYANRSVEDCYKLVSHRQLGKGRASEVVFAFNVSSGEHAAVKVISKDKTRPTDREFAEKEVSIRMSVQHPYIVQTLDLFESPHDLFLVMEFMGGSTLHRRMLVRNAPVPEPHARVVMVRVLSALAYLHSREIIHRNIKAENILLDLADELRWSSTAKLSDLGLACFVDDPESSRQIVGTPEYLAPEAAVMATDGAGVRQVVFGTEIDLWASGVTLYNLLSQQLPFDGESTPEVLRAVRGGQFRFPRDGSANVSQSAKSLIRSLLNVDRRKRLTAQTALLHPWFSNPCSSSSPSGAPSSPRRWPRAGFPMFRAAATVVVSICRLARATPGVYLEAMSGQGHTMKRFQFSVTGINIAPKSDQVSPVSRTLEVYGSPPMSPTLSSRISTGSSVISRASVVQVNVPVSDVTSATSGHGGSVVGSRIASGVTRKDSKMEALAKGLIDVLRMDGVYPPVYVEKGNFRKRGGTSRDSDNVVSPTGLDDGSSGTRSDNPVGRRRHFGA